MSVSSHSTGGNARTLRLAHGAAGTRATPSAATLRDSLRKEKIICSWQAAGSAPPRRYNHSCTRHSNTYSDYKRGGLRVDNLPALPVALHRVLPALDQQRFEVRVADQPLAARLHVHLQELFQLCRRKGRLDLPPTPRAALVRHSHADATHNARPLPVSPSHGLAQDSLGVGTCSSPSASTSRRSVDPCSLCSACTRGGVRRPTERLRAGRRRRPARVDGVLIKRPASKENLIRQAERGASLNSVAVEGRGVSD
jgi:hypothetical protein